MVVQGRYELSWGPPCEVCEVCTHTMHTCRLPFRDRRKRRWELEILSLLAISLKAHSNCSTRKSRFVNDQSKAPTRQSFVRQHGV